MRYTGVRLTLIWNRILFWSPHMIFGLTAVRQPLDLTTARLT